MPCASAQDICPPSKIGVDIQSVQSSGTISTVLGRVINACNIPASVHLKMVFYSESGRLVRVQDFWPASTYEIPPKAEFPFQVRFERIEDMYRYEASVLNVRSSARGDGFSRR